MCYGIIEEERLVNYSPYRKFKNNPVEELNKKIIALIE